MRPGLSRVAALAAIALCASGCAGTIGVQQAGPGLWVVSEMRAPVLGGGPAAQAAAMAEANGFCGQSGLAPDVLDVTPGGNPYGPYGPVAFTVRFRCVARHAG